LDEYGRSKGCALVKYKNEETAADVLQEVHGKYLCGVPMKVLWAESKTQSRRKK